MFNNNKKANVDSPTSASQANATAVNVEKVAHRLERKRCAEAKRRLNATEEQKKIRLENFRENTERRIQNETEEEKKNRLENDRENKERRRENEYELDRQNRIENMRNYKSTRRNNKSAIQKDASDQRHCDDKFKATPLKEFLPNPIIEFAEKMNNIQLNLCAICQERRPNLPVNQSGVCSRCQNDRQGTVKLFGKDNLMDPGAVPSELQGLTQIEEILIAQYVPFMSVTTRPYGQLAYSGHTINFPQDIGEICSILPRLSSQIGVIILKKRNAPQNQPSSFRVRREKVHQALLWKKRNDPYYRNIEICSERLSLLPGY